MIRSRQKTITGRQCIASTSYKAYPQVSKDIVGRIRIQKKQLDEKDKQLKEFQDQLSGTYARVLFHRPSVYVGGWKFGSKQGEHESGHCGAGEAGPEILTRWVAFLKKSREFFVPDRLAKMTASGGSVDEAATLANKFLSEGRRGGQASTQDQGRRSGSACDAQDGRNSSI